MYFRPALLQSSHIRIRGTYTHHALEAKVSKLTKLKVQAINPETIQLYRQALRQIKTFPIASFKNKLKFNVRELFELYRFEEKGDSLNKLIEDGKHDIKFLGSWKYLDEHDIKALFKKGQIKE